MGKLFWNFFHKDTRRETWEKIEDWIFDQPHAIKGLIRLVTVIFFFTIPVIAIGFFVWFLWWLHWTIGLVATISLIAGVFFWGWRD